VRIAYIAASYTVHDARFIGTAAAAGHEVVLIRLDRTRALVLPVGAHEVHWDPPRSQRPREWAALAPALRAILDREHPDVVHAGPVQSCGYAAATAGATPLIVMSWASDLLIDAERDDEWREATLRALGAADLLLCDNGAVVEKAVSLGYRRDRVVVFAWGVDLHDFRRRPEVRKATRERLGFLGRTATLSTRSWEPIYGIDVLLNAFARAHARRNDLLLILAGGGSGAPTVNAAIDALGIRAAVILPGVLPHADLPHWFCAADLYMTCARSDGTSVSLLEAMASGLPAIVTDIPGNREWIAPGTNGWLVPPGDVDGFSAALIAAAELSAPARATIARANRQIVERRADWADGARLLLGAYERVARSGGAER
jgi:glycosyltransferase involved in cell wall biosynthesis